MVLEKAGEDRQVGRLVQASRGCNVAGPGTLAKVPQAQSAMTGDCGGKQEPSWGLTSLGMKDDPSVTRDQKAMPPHMRYFRLYLSPR